MVLCGIMPLPDALAGILLIVLDGDLVQRGFRLEEADLEGNAQVLEAVPDDADDTVADAGILKLQAKLPLRVDLVLEAESGPRLRLRLLHEVGQDAVEKAEVRAVGSRTLGIAAFRGQEGSLNVALEAFFGLINGEHSNSFYYKEKQTGNVYVILVGSPFRYAGFHFGELETTRTASASSSGYTPRITITLATLPSASTEN